MNHAASGYPSTMTETPEDKHVETRAELLPEEERAGSEDPHDQAEQILKESAERTEDPEGTGAASTQTSTPDERPGG